MSALADALALLSLTADEVLRRLGPGVEDDPESDYEGLEDVRELNNRTVFPGSVYLRDGRVVLVYLPRSAVEGLDRATLEQELLAAGATSEPVRLRSRAGKKASMYVRAGDGVAYSADANRVHFIEVFAPSSLDDYRTGIYVEPGKFVR